VVLVYAAMGKTPSRWFTQIPGRFRGGGGTATYAFYLGVKAAALMRGIALPPQTCVPAGQESRMLPLLKTGTGTDGYVIDTSASAALRLALAAKQAGTSLANVTFLTSGEPLTPTKVAAIRGSGAHAFSYYSFTEFGRATFGCASPASADDAHICLDIAAIITRRRGVDHLGSEVDALLVTALRPEARRILLNAETGDYARLTRRKCDCLLEELGWVEHLEEIRSFEKLTPEGGTFLGSKLISLVEDTLPNRFGGEPIDYQLLEHEDPDGSTRLTVLVHPRLGGIDENALLRCVESTLSDFDYDVARVQKETGSLRVRRIAPVVTKGVGKLMPLHRFRPGDLPPGEFDPLR
jgi:hypothetical protein